MKRLRMLCAVLALVALALPLAAEPVTNPAIAVTDASQTIIFGGSPKQAVCVRGGASTEDEVYYRLFDDCDTLAASTTSYIRLEPGESDCYTFDPGEGDHQACVAGGYVALSIICAAAETATARYTTK